MYRLVQITMHSVTDRRTDSDRRHYHANIM